MTRLGVWAGSGSCHLEGNPEVQRREGTARGPRRDVKSKEGWGSRGQGGNSWLGSGSEVETTMKRTVAGRLYWELRSEKLTRGS